MTSSPNQTCSQTGRDLSEVELRVGTDIEPSPSTEFGKKGGGTLIDALKRKGDERNIIMKLFHKNDKNSPLEFSCSLCDFKADWVMLCITHMKNEHPGWKDQIQISTGMKSILCL